MAEGHSRNHGAGATGHPQHSAEKLFNRATTPNAGERAEDISEGTVPTFLQSIDGDDMFDRARRVESSSGIQS